jgi:hypothetical protein
MVVIIKKEDGKPIFNAINITKEEKIRAQKLDKVLSKIGPKIEEKWLKERMIEKDGRKIDIRLAYQIGKILAKIIDNKDLVSPNEKRWIWKALREMYIKNSTFIKRGETRDDLEYFYKASRYPLKFVKNISWDGWRRLLDAPGVQQDKRFEEWLQQKAAKADTLKRSFVRRFVKHLYSMIKNKDTTVLTDSELFAIYESAWNLAMISQGNL